MSSLYLILLGLLGQFFYFLRFFVQWYHSECQQRVVIPLSFWYISLIGAILLLVYSLLRRDIVFIIGSVLSMFIYGRNIILSDKNEV